MTSFDLRGVCPYSTKGPSVLDTRWGVYRELHGYSRAPHTTLPLLLHHPVSTLVTKPQLSWPGSRANCASVTLDLRSLNTSSAISNNTGPEIPDIPLMGSRPIITPLVNPQTISGDSIIGGHVSDLYKCPEILKRYYLGRSFFNSIQMATDASTANIW